jgi:hypothetical protein
MSESEQSTNTESVNTGNTLSYSMPTEAIRKMIKLAIDYHGSVYMDPKRFLKAVKFPDIDSLPLSNKLVIIQDYLRDRMSNVGWLLVLSEDFVNARVIWHVISDEHPRYKELMQKGTLHTCSKPLCDL